VVVLGVVVVVFEVAAFPMTAPPAVMAARAAAAVVVRFSWRDMFWILSGSGFSKTPMVGAPVGNELGHRYETAVSAAKPFAQGGVGVSTGRA
jgi:hypothetical protein